MYLDHKNFDSIKHNINIVWGALLGLRASLHRCTSVDCCEHLDVRLVSNADGQMWIATGDVQYDTTHGAACEAVSLDPSLTDDDLAVLARDLVKGVVDQLGDGDGLCPVCQDGDCQTKSEECGK